MIVALVEEGYYDNEGGSDYQHPYEKFEMPVVPSIGDHIELSTQPREVVRVVRRSFYRLNNVWECLVIVVRA